MDDLTSFKKNRREKREAVIKPEVVEEKNPLRGGTEKKKRSIPKPTFPQRDYKGKADSPCDHPLNPSISIETITRTEHAIEALHIQGDYRFANVPSVIRAALLKYLAGEISVSEKARAGSKKRVQVLIKEQDFEKYDEVFSPFARKKSELIERILLTFIRTQLDS